MPARHDHAAPLHHLDHLLLRATLVEKDGLHAAREQSCEHVGARLVGTIDEDVGDLARVRVTVRVSVRGLALT